MSEFKIGDKVCIIQGRDVKRGDGICPWNPWRDKFVGAIATVCDVLDEGQGRYVETKSERFGPGRAYRCGWAPEWLELVEEDQMSEYQVGDRVVNDRWAGTVQKVALRPESRGNDTLVEWDSRPNIPQLSCETWSRNLTPEPFGVGDWVRHPHAPKGKPGKVLRAEPAGWVVDYLDIGVQDGQIGLRKVAPGSAEPTPQWYMDHHDYRVGDRVWCSGGKGTLVGLLDTDGFLPILLDEKCEGGSDDRIFKANPGNLHEDPFGVGDWVREIGHAPIGHFRAVEAGAAIIDWETGEKWAVTGGLDGFREVAPPAEKASALGALKAGDWVRVFRGKFDGQEGEITMRMPDGRWFVKTLTGAAFRRGSDLMRVEAPVFEVGQFVRSAREKFEVVGRKWREDGVCIYFLDNEHERFWGQAKDLRAIEDAPPEDEHAFELGDLVVHEGRVRQVVVVSHDTCGLGDIGADACTPYDAVPGRELVLHRKRQQFEVGDYVQCFNQGGSHRVRSGVIREIDGGMLLVALADGQDPKVFWYTVSEMEHAVRPLRTCGGDDEHPPCPYLCRPEGTGAKCLGLTLEQRTGPVLRCSVGDEGQTGVQWQDRCKRGYDWAMRNGKERSE